MFRQKSLVEKVGDNIRSGVQSAREATSGVSSNVTSVAQSATNSLANIKQNISKSVEDFSNTKFFSKEFLTSNSILAKFTFIILVLIVFMVIFRVCVYVLQYLFVPPNDPYIVYGTLDGSDKKVLFQDKTKGDSVSILRSSNRHGGAEFTYSTWLYLRAPNGNTNATKTIFVKGSNVFDDSTNYGIINGPGMYLDETVDSANVKEYKLVVKMDTVNSGITDDIVVEHLPIAKWFHVAIRLQNTMVDIYVNGTIAKRHNLTAAPKQNYSDIIVNGNGGFTGQLSNLRYYSRALNIFEINNIVMWGPSTHKSSLATDARANSGSYSYLSSLWYKY